MNKKLFIGNLGPDVTDGDLRDNFSSVGKVLSVDIIKDQYSGLSKGFGFIEMETEKEAADAIQKFNGGELRGKAMTVNEARPKRDSAGGGGYRSEGNRSGGGGGYGNRGRGGGGRRY